MAAVVALYSFFLSPVVYLYNTSRNEIIDSFLHARAGAPCLPCLGREGPLPGPSGGQSQGRAASEPHQSRVGAASEPRRSRVGAASEPHQSRVGATSEPRRSRIGAASEPRQSHGRKREEKNAGLDKFRMGIHSGKDYKEIA